MLYCISQPLAIQFRFYVVILFGNVEKKINKNCSDVDCSLLSTVGCAIYLFISLFYRLYKSHSKVNAIGAHIIFLSLSYFVCVFNFSLSGWILFAKRMQVACLPIFVFVLNRIFYQIY